MSRTYFGAIGVAAVMILVLAPANGQDAVDQEGIALAPGIAETIRTIRGARAIVIGDPNIASASVVSDEVITITAKEPGITNLIALDEDGGEILRTTITVSTPSALPPAPRDGARIRVRSVGGDSRGSGELVRNYLCSPRSLCVLTTSQGETPPTQTVQVNGTVQAPQLPRGRGFPDAGRDGNARSGGSPNRSGSDVGPTGVPAR